MNSSTFLGKLLLYVPVKLIPAATGIFFIVLLYSVLPEGGYVSYSVSIASALIAAQLGSAWIGNSYIYCVASADNRATLFYSCLWSVLIIAPVAAIAAGVVSTVFVDDYAFYNVVLLCFSQALFFFLSSVYQATFQVRHQLVAILLQAVGQVVTVLVIFERIAVNYKFAILSLSVGYLAASLFLLLVKLKEHGAENLIVGKKAFVASFTAIYQYGSALSPWMLGMLIMAAADRFALGHYNLAGGDAYLSLKDLFIGASGLLSMPLLMMVHSLLINRFREGHFAIDIVEASISFLVIAFAALWVALDLWGLELFERIADRQVGLSISTIFLAFCGVFLASVSVYAQKRMEVHRKIGRLAILSIGCALVSIVLCFIAGATGKILGVAVAAVLAQMLYLAVLMYTLRKKIQLVKFCMPILWAFLLFGIGELLSHAMGPSRNSLGYWIGSLMLLAGFSFFACLALWKGIDWKSFTERGRRTSIRRSLA
ncbi:hypothetical protein KEM63_05720 [Halopseudomonas nanhaiensis]|uniref:hypothetical protein n=1 Tax=Halopseudomonas nanhaiensis TaxID=2830842 RepID=UPI001CBD6269|nr:hypothetical protein [Halopseudomonas nanhaiensis]UAW99464.1 hypothetical protein KEM63_05720 [Halopseudomonas nanhaiensis]